MSTAPDVQTPGAGVLPGLPAGGGSARGLRAALCRAFVAALGRVDNPALLPLALAQAQALVPAGANGLALLHEFADSPGWPARYLAARLLGERSATAGRQVMAHAWPVLERLAADRERWVAEGAAWGFGALLRADPAYWGPRFVSVFADLPPSVPPTGDHAEGDGRSAGDHDAAAPPAVRRALLFGVVPALRDGPADARQVALEVIDRAAGDPSSATRQLGSLVAGRELAAHLPQEALALVERWAASGDSARQWQAARALTPTVRSIDRERSEAVIARLQQAADPAVRSALRGALKDEVAGGQWPVASGGGGVRPGRAGSGRAHIDNGWDEEDGLERNARPARPGSGPSGAGPEARPALGEPGASGAPRAGTGHWPLATGHWSEDWQTTADIPISASLIEQMVGQDRAVEIVRLAAQQRRFVLMVGEPGTGKSMLAAAMAEMMGADHDGGLEDILVLPNAESRITPLIEAVPAGEGERRVREAKKRRGETETAITFLFWAASLAASLIAGWYALATRSAVPGIVAAVVIAVLWGVRRFFRSPVRLSVPKLLVTNARAVEANLAPFVDATGFHAGALLGDVRHDPFQSGGYETPPHELVEPGAIHLAHRGVLFIDEVSTLSIESQQSLLTAIQEKRFPISGRTLGSSGTMIRSAPAPCDFLLILAGNMQDVEKMHPALRSRVRGYGYEIYMAEDMPDTPESRTKLARFCAQEVAKDRKIPHLSRAAVDAIVEEARVRSGRRDRLTVRLRELGGLVRAAGDLAAQAGDPLVEPHHVAAGRENTRTLEEQMAGTDGGRWTADGGQEASRPVGPPQALGPVAGLGTPRPLGPVAGPAPPAGNPPAPRTGAGAGDPGPRSAVRRPGAAGDSARPLFQRRPGATRRTRGASPLRRVTPRNWSNVVSRQTRTADGGRPSAVPLSAVPLSAVRCLRSYRLATLFVPALVWGGCATSQPRAVVVTAHSFRFEPATVEVAYQQPIRLTLRNPDVLEHDFHVDGLKAKVAAGADQHAHGGALGGQGETGEAGQGGGSTGQPGDADSLHVHTAAGRSAAVVFTPLARGTFAVSCTIPGHKEAGMAATLVVR